MSFNPFITLDISRDLETHGRDKSKASGQKMNPKMQFKTSAKMATKHHYFCVSFANQILESLMIPT